MSYVELYDKYHSVFLSSSVISVIIMIAAITFGLWAFYRDFCTSKVAWKKRLPITITSVIILLIGISSCGVSLHNDAMMQQSQNMITSVNMKYQLRNDIRVKKDAKLHAMPNARHTYKIYSRQVANDKRASQYNKNIKEPTFLDYL